MQQSSPSTSRTDAPVRSSVRVLHDIADLGVVFDDDVATIFVRQPLDASTRLAAHAAVLKEDLLLRLVVSHDDDGHTALRKKLDPWVALADDIHFLVGVLADLTGYSTVGVRLARTTTAMCPRFHVDHVGLRVVRTYVGKGTECLGNEHRRHPGQAPGDVVFTDDDVHRAHVGDVVFLKGEGWQDNEGRGAVHRSPCASGDAPRLVLTLDLVGEVHGS